MATYSQTRAAGNVADDAAFRALFKWFSDNMTTSGWVKTGDTGQVDWTTVTKPTVANTVAGYEIRESPTQSGYQKIYLKIEFGSGSAATYPAIWITLGTGTDGAGALTGTTTTRDQFFANNNVAVEDLLCVTDNHFTLMLQGPQSGAGVANAWLVVERRTTADGNYETEGWTVVDCGGSIGFTQSMNATGANTSFTGQALGYIPPSYSGSGGVVHVAPVMPNRPGAQYPLRGIAFIVIGNAGYGSTFSFAMFPGKTQTWRSCLGTTTVGGLNLADIPANLSPVFRWE